MALVICEARFYLCRHTVLPEFWVIEARDLRLNNIPVNLVSAPFNLLALRVEASTVSSAEPRSRNSLYGYILFRVNPQRQHKDIQIYELCLVNKGLPLIYLTADVSF